MRSFSPSFLRPLRTISGPEPPARVRTSSRNRAKAQGSKDAPDEATTARLAARPAAAGSLTGPLDVVLLTAGGAERLYIPALQALAAANAVRVRGIVDARPAEDRPAHAAFPEALYVRSLDLLPPLPNALAILATAARFHGAHANAALKRGWHVLSGSPLAANAGDATAMIAAAQRHERLLAVDLRARFFPAAIFLRTLCQDQLLGPLLSFDAQRGRTRFYPEESAGREKIDRTDGALTALGLPPLELLTWCFGSAVVHRYADDAMGGVEANAIIDLGFRENVRGTVHLSLDWPIEDHYTFVFERGVARWNPARVNSITLQLASAPAALAAELMSPLSAIRPLEPAALIATEDQACIALLENIIAAIAGREPLRTAATEAMHSLPLIETCYAQRVPAAQPWLPRNDAMHARALSPPALLRRS